LIIFSLFFVYLGITEANFFNIDFLDPKNTESILAISIIFSFFLIWILIALIGRTTLVLNADKFSVLERPFKFLSFSYKLIEIKRFDLFTERKLDSENPEIFAFVMLLTQSGEQKKILTFKSIEESSKACEKLQKHLIKIRGYE